MAKKFGKILLLTAAVTTAAAAAVYYLQKKDSYSPLHADEDEDYDDFSDELDDETDAASRSYVPLHREHSDEVLAGEVPADETPSEEIEKIEEFFSEEDSE